MTLNDGASTISTVAILSDLHGVLPAVDAILAEPDVATADRVVLTGDLAAGPMPVETLDRLVGLGERAVWIRGNADRELVDLARGGTTTIPDPIAPWAAAQLRADQVELLAGLPQHTTLTIDGFGPVLFCHATPRSDDEVVLVDSRLKRWDEVLADVDPAVTTISCGHTHMPYQRLVDRRLVINPGSVGMTYGRPGAHWALLTGGTVQLRVSHYDLDQAAATIAAAGYPDSDTWVATYLRSPYSDRDAINAFGPRDGRSD